MNESIQRKKEQKERMLLIKYFKNETQKVQSRMEHLDQWGEKQNAILKTRDEKLKKLIQETGVKPRMNYHFLRKNHSVKIRRKTLKPVRGGHGRSRGGTDH